MNRRLKRIRSICLLLGVAIVAFAFLALRPLFDSAPSALLSNGVTVRLHHVTHPSDTPPSGWKLTLRRVLLRRALPAGLTPRWLQASSSSSPTKHFLWIEANGGQRYICTITDTNGQTIGETNEYRMGAHLGDPLFELAVDEFPPTDLMAINFYQDDRSPVMSAGPHAKPELFLGRLIVPTPTQGRMVLLATNSFPAKTNFAEVEVSVEKVELFPEPFLDQRREWMGRAYLGFRENGILTTNWDTAWFSRIDHHLGSVPLSGAKTWTDGLREIYFSSAAFPERGWKIRADIVRKKNFPETELMLITNVPAPGSENFPADWEIATNWNGSLVTLKSMREISFSVSGGTRTMQPSTPGLVAMTVKDSGLVPRIARVEAETGELLHDPLNRWGDEWSSVSWSAATHGPRARTLRVWINVQKPRRIQLAGTPERLTNTPALSH